MMEIRPIDQSRACRVALGTLTANTDLICEALDEAIAEDTLINVLASAARTWVSLSVETAGAAVTEEALRAAIFDAEVAQ